MRESHLSHNLNKKWWRRNINNADIFKIKKNATNKLSHQMHLLEHNIASQKNVNKKLKKYLMKSLSLSYKTKTLLFILNTFYATFQFFVFFVVLPVHVFHVFVCTHMCFFHSSQCDTIVLSLFFRGKITLTLNFCSRLTCF